MKILLKAYAKRNLGDDLFVKILLDYFPQHQFYLEANSIYSEIFKDYSNLIIFQSKQNILDRAAVKFSQKFNFKLYQKFKERAYFNQYNNFIKNFDGFISIGGSIFIEPNNPLDINEYSYYKAINRLFKTNKFIIGANFGPFKSSIYVKQYADIFKSFTHITFRDFFSQKYFPKLHNLSVFPDLIFYLNLASLKNIKNPKNVGFSIVSENKICSVKNNENYLKNYLDLIEKYIEKGHQVKLFSFCQKEGDEKTINDIYDKLNSTGKENVEKVFYTGNMEEFLTKYSTVETMYCGRFHSMVISLLLNQKIFPINYSNKMLQVLNDLAYDGPYLSAEEFCELKEIDTLIELSEKAQNFEVSQEIIQNSQNHLQILNQLLK